MRSRIRIIIMKIIIKMLNVPGIKVLKERSLKREEMGIKGYLIFLSLN